MRRRRFNVRNRFAIVPQHDKHADLNAPCLQHVCLLLHVRNIRFALHAVQNALRAALRTNPEAIAAHFRQGVDHILVQAVRAADALKWQAQAPLLQLRVIGEKPARVDGQYVISIPE